MLYEKLLYLCKRNMYIVLHLTQLNCPQLHYTAECIEPVYCKICHCDVHNWFIVIIYIYNGKLGCVCFFFWINTFKMKWLHSNSKNKRSLPATKWDELFWFWNGKRLLFAAWARNTPEILFLTLQLKNAFLLRAINYPDKLSPKLKLDTFNKRSHSGDVDRILNP